MTPFSVQKEPGPRPGSSRFVRLSRPESADRVPPGGGSVTKEVADHLELLGSQGSANLGQRAVHGAVETEQLRPTLVSRVQTNTTTVLGSGSRVTHPPSSNRSMTPVSVAG